MGVHRGGAGKQPRLQRKFLAPEIRAHTHARQHDADDDDGRDRAWRAWLAQSPKLELDAEAWLLTDADDLGYVAGSRSNSFTTYAEAYGLATGVRTVGIDPDVAPSFRPTDLLASYAPYPPGPHGPDWGHDAICTRCRRAREDQLFRDPDNPHGRWVDPETGHDHQDAALTAIARDAATLRLPDSHAWAFLQGGTAVRRDRRRAERARTADDVAAFRDRLLAEITDRLAPTDPDADPRPTIDPEVLELLEAAVPDFWFVVAVAAGMSLSSMGLAIDRTHTVARRRLDRARSRARATLAEQAEQVFGIALRGDGDERPAVPDDPTGPRSHGGDAATDRLDPSPPHLCTCRQDDPAPGALHQVT